jgi:signal transduction histidine kinase
MNLPSDRRRRWLVRLVAFGIWTFLGVFAASQTYLVLYSATQARTDLNRVDPSQISGTELLRLAMAELYVWGILSIFIFRLGRLIPLDQRRWPRSVACHLVFSAAFAVLETTIMVPLNQLLRCDLMKPTVSWQVLKFYFFAKFHANVFYYWVILGVGQCLDYYRKYRAREREALQLEARLAEAQLQVLKMQLHPHFLFNTLHAISALIHQDVEVADRMIARLGDLLRSTLESANEQEVSLKQELDFIEPYLEIQQARLGPRLQVKMDIDPEIMDARVPNLILQPLVENAIRHGVAPRTEPGLVEIRAWREQGLLQLQVRDDGPGLCGPPKKGCKEGLGLSNTRARLQQLYRDAHSFQLTNGQVRGLVVTVTIPIRELGAELHPNTPEDTGGNPDSHR